MREQRARDSHPAGRKRLSLAEMNSTMTVVEFKRCRILVTGSREWNDRAQVKSALTDAVERLGSPVPPILISGNARGVDRIAEQFWESLGWPVERHPVTPDMWQTEGKRAGISRNERMIASGADLCLAFILDDSPGASHCSRAALAAGIPTTIYREYTSD